MKSYRQGCAVFCTFAGLFWSLPGLSLTPAPDYDNDGVDDFADVCPFTPDSSQQDTDSDGVGDACEPFCLPAFGDVSANGVTDIVDAQCTILTSLWVLASSDVAPPSCLGVAPEQADADCSGDVAVTDVLLVIGEALGIPPAPEVDTDFDGCPDTCGGLVPDGDDDGVPDDLDTCPGVPNPDQNDTDLDGVGDACEACSSDPEKITPGVCGCGLPDTDTDQDGFADCVDACGNAQPVLATVGGSSVVVPMVLGTSACVAFDAVSDQRISITMVHNLGECVDYTLFDPEGGIFLGPTLSCSSTIFVDLTILPTGGAYQLHLAPIEAVSGTITVTVHDVPPDAMLNGILGGPMVPVSLAVPAQNGFVHFEASPGTRASFRSVSSPPKCTRYTLTAPDGSALVGPVLTCSSEYFTDLVILPQQGVYILKIDPHENATSTYSVQGFVVPPDDVESMVPGGPAVQLGMGVPAQNGFVEFFAIAGERISVVSQASPTVCRGLSLIAPSGGALGLPQTTCSGTAFLEVIVVTETGLHSLFVNPNGSGVTTENVTIYWVPDDLVETVVAGAPSIDVPLLVPGQDGFVEFEGAVGQKIAISATRSPSGCTRYGLVGPLGTVLAPQLTCGTYFADVITLTAVGTYTLSIDPHDQYAGTHTISIFDVPPDITVTAAIGGPSVNVSTTVPGQNGVVTFSGTMGANIGIVASHAPGGCIHHRLLNPSGTTLFGPQLVCGTLTTATLTLPETGTYSFLADGNGAYVGTTTVSVLVK